MKDINAQDVRLWLFTHVAGLSIKGFPGLNPDKPGDLKKLEAICAKQEVLYEASRIIAESAPSVYLTLEEVGISDRIVELLRGAGIREPYDLAGKSEDELFSIPGFGWEELAEVARALRNRDVKLGLPASLTQKAGS